MALDEFAVFIITIINTHSLSEAAAHTHTHTHTHKAYYSYIIDNGG